MGMPSMRVNQLASFSGPRWRAFSPPSFPMRMKTAFVSRALSLNFSRSAVVF